VGKEESEMSEERKYLQKNASRRRLQLCQRCARDRSVKVLSPFQKPVIPSVTEFTPASRT